MERDSGSREEKKGKNATERVASAPSAWPSCFLSITVASAPSECPSLFVHNRVVVPLSQGFRHKRRGASREFNGRTGRPDALYMGSNARRPIRVLFVLNGCTIQRRTYCVNSLCLSSAITVRQIQLQPTLAKGLDACITHLRNHTLYKKHLI